MSIMINKKNNSVVLHLTANSGTLVVAGNSSVSNLAISDEIIETAQIDQVWWGGAGDGYWEVLRGANTVLVLAQEGYFDFRGNGVSINKDKDATLTINYNPGTNTASPGFMIIELSKQGVFTSEYLVG